MALNPAAVGKTTGELTFTYRWQDVVLYGLGIGARTRDLDYLYEGRGPKVFPTFAVVPTFEANARLLPELGGDMLGVVHGSQTIRTHRPFAPSGTLKTVGRVAAIYDMKKFAQALITTETRNEASELLCETEWSILFRFDGGFGGSPPPKREDARAPDRAPDFTAEEPTSAEQALLYRLSGDLNPLHADPQIAEMAGFQRPLLHGLCTYGYVGRAVLANACGGDPSRFKSLTGLFRKPVFPGDTLVTEGWIEGKRVIVRASVKDKPGEYVFSGSYAEVE